MKQSQTQPANTPVSLRRQFRGEVVSLGGNKTIHVRTKSLKMHPKYRKQYAVSKKYAVHDETGNAALGNVVVFEECRPISKTKRWRLVRVLSSATLGTAIE